MLFQCCCSLLLPLSSKFSVFCYTVHCYILSDIFVCSYLHICFYVCSHTSAIGLSPPVKYQLEHATSRLTNVHKTALFPPLFLAFDDVRQIPIFKNDLSRIAWSAFHLIATVVSLNGLTVCLNDDKGSEVYNTNNFLVYYLYIV